ncbi:MAG: bifunctional glutamate N-acetyltransferase/amino-acid acetyltransferase ArgJ, partial [Oscillospiraceae bacterium]
VYNYFQSLDPNENDILIASTGVIGQPLPLKPITDAMPQLVNSLSDDEKASDDAAHAIMTTDTVKKEISIEFKIGDTICKMGGIAKGSGMIHPNMATMLVFVTTDAAISPKLVQKALSTDVESSFNMVSVDGDTSTNDTVLILASGRAKNKEIAKEDESYDQFCKALSYVTTYLCKEIAKDGEGATKMIICNTHNSNDLKTARTVAKSVITSSLFKAAIFGKDANWGRILCAIGYADCDFDIKKIDVSLSSNAGKVDVCKDGHGIDFSEEKALIILNEAEITVDIDMNSGTECATAWGCDLTYDYVKINGDYRT